MSLTIEFPLFGFETAAGVSVLIPGTLGTLAIPLCSDAETASSIGNQLKLYPGCIDRPLRSLKETIDFITASANAYNESSTKISGVVLNLKLPSGTGDYFSLDVFLDELTESLISSVLASLTFPVFAIGTKRAIALMDTGDSAYVPLFQLRSTASMAALGAGLPETQTVGFEAQALLDVLEQREIDSKIILSEADITVEFDRFKEFLIVQSARARQSKFN